MAILDRFAASVPVPNLLDLPADVQQKWLDEAADMGDSRCKAYALYDEFYDGDHRARLRDRARRYLEDLTGVPFTENFTQPAVDVLAERLEVVGFTSSAAVETVDENGKDVTTDPAATACEDWWQRCRMDATQGRVHRNVLKRGDEFLIVDWDSETSCPVFARQKPTQVKVVYSDDAPDKIDYACKVWHTSMLSRHSNPAGARVTRLNVYWPGRIDKWFQTHQGSVWERWYDDPADDTTRPEWPTWWTTTGTAEGEPLGVAVVHFRNMPRDDGMGISRVKQAIPFQTELNKVVADLNDLIDTHADPQDWVSGVTSDEIDLTRVGGVWQLLGENAKAGRLPASETANLLNAVEGVLSRMARRLRIPMHLLTGGTPPSGEALKTSESGLVQTAKDAQVEIASSWEDAMLLGLRLAAAFGEGSPEVPEILEVQWANPETRSDSEDLQAAEAKKRLGVSQHTLLAELGYDPAKEQERRTGEQAAAAEAQGALFDRGGLPV